MIAVKNKKTWIIVISIVAAFVLIYLIAWGSGLLVYPDDTSSEVSDQSIESAETTTKQTEEKESDISASEPLNIQPTTSGQIPATSKYEETMQKDHPKIVYWGHTGDKIHINPECRTIKNGTLSGSLDEAKAAGHNGWCGICSKDWSDERLLEDGNPYADN